MRRLLLVLLFGILLSLPAALAQNCGNPTFWRVHHLWRVGFNEVEALAGTQVLGDNWAYWDTFVESTEKLNGVVLHEGSDAAVGGQTSAQWNDAPSLQGTGTYTTSNKHKAVCGIQVTESTSADSLTVLEPTIENLPYLNSLWYFGPNTPDPVPTAEGNAFQSASLTFNKNCGPGDTCTGAVAWSELDPPNNISVNSSGYLKSTGRGTCRYDSAVKATLDGWTVIHPIAVNSPEFLWASQQEQTVAWGVGYLTRKFWSIADACPYSVPSVAVREEFGVFQNPGVISGWPDPSLTWASGFNYTSYIFYDSIGAELAYDPAPTFTSASPPYTYYTRLKYAAQRWFAGSQSAGARRQVFTGTIEFYRDHGDSHE